MTRLVLCAFLLAVLVHCTAASEFRGHLWLYPYLLVKVNFVSCTVLQTVYHGYVVSRSQTLAERVWVRETVSWPAYVQ